LTLTGWNDKLQASTYSLKGGMQHDNQRIIHQHCIKRASRKGGNDLDRYQGTLDFAAGVLRNPAVFLLTTWDPTGPRRESELCAIVAAA